MHRARVSTAAKRAKTAVFSPKTRQSARHKYATEKERPNALFFGELAQKVREHVELTGSPRGKEILDNFSEFLPKFKKVLPYDYDHMLRVIASMEERGLDGEQAQIEAFYAVQKKK